MNPGFNTLPFRDNMADWSSLKLQILLTFPKQSIFIMFLIDMYNIPDIIMCILKQLAIQLHWNITKTHLFCSIIWKDRIRWEIFQLSCLFSSKCNNTFRKICKFCNMNTKTLIASPWFNLVNMSKWRAWMNIDFTCSLENWRQSIINLFNRHIMNHLNATYQLRQIKWLDHWITIDIVT